MRSLLSVLAAYLFLGNAAAQKAVPPAKNDIAAVIESTLATGGAQIRQFAFDGDPDTYFASDKNPVKSDHLTLTFDKPVQLASVKVTTGKPKGGDLLHDGVLEYSADGKKFEVLAHFKDGIAQATEISKEAQAIRIRPTKDMKHPLVVREIEIDAKPKVTKFRYPIEFTLDVADAPEMKEWGEKVVRVCEQQYPMICEELMSKGFKPMTQISLAFKNDYKGVAAAGGGHITGSVKYFKNKPGDIGAFVHETTHCVQDYHQRGLPGWLVEGIADYIRFYKYEPGKAGKLNPDRAKYDGSYRITAAFLAYVAETHDPKFVTKLNALMRDGKYDESTWRTLTGKSVEELDRDWRKTLVK